MLDLLESISNTSSCLCIYVELYKFEAEAVCRPCWFGSFLPKQQHPLHLRSQTSSTLVSISSTKIQIANITRGQTKMM